MGTNNGGVGRKARASKRGHMTTSKKRKGNMRTYVNRKLDRKNMTNDKTQRLVVKGAKSLR